MTVNVDQKYVALSNQHGQKEAFREQATLLFLHHLM